MVISPQECFFSPSSFALFEQCPLSILLAITVAINNSSVTGAKYEESTCHMIEIDSLEKSQK